MLSFAAAGAAIPARSRAPARRRRAACGVRMSGVNGGIDYEIDVARLPAPLAERVRYVQGGPDSPTELIAASREIAAAAPAYPDTLPVLVDMLGFNNPVAAGVAVDALAAAGSAAVPALLSGVAAFNYAVNAYALRALGRIGDPAVVDVCVECAERGPIPNVRRAACRALAGLRIVDPVDAERAHATLVALAEAEPDWGVRYAAIVGLECFSSCAALAPDERQRAFDAVRATSEAGFASTSGERGANALTDAEQSTDGEKEDVVPGASVDPTVVARATVALAAMESGVKSPEAIAS